MRRQRGEPQNLTEVGRIDLLGRCEFCRRPIHLGFQELAPPEGPRHAEDRVTTDCGPTAVTEALCPPAFTSGLMALLGSKKQAVKPRETADRTSRLGHESKNARSFCYALLKLISYQSFEKH
jgi:hypothetical protein